MSTEPEKPLDKIDLSPIWVTGLPMPKTSNHQYTPWMNRRTGKMSFIPSRELKEYKVLLDKVFYKNATFFMSNMKKLKAWLAQGVFLEVRATFLFERSKIVTLKNTPKKLDVQNREKALFDGVSKLLGVDDSLFFKVSAEKRLIHKGQQESVSVEIIPYFVDL